MDNSIIITETKRPIWQIIISALLYTLALFLMYLSIINKQNNLEYVKHISNNSYLIVILISTAVGLSSIRKIYVDIKNSRFRPTFEVLFLKFGKWKTIDNYEYVSIFHQLLKNGDYIYEVNLWYDTNKHFRLYKKNDYKEAFIIGYELSEELDVSLLDATVPNDYKWIDKDKWKSTMKTP